MKCDREQIKALWQGDVPDYYPSSPCSFWAATIKRWQNEGLNPNDDANIVAGLDESWSISAPLNMGFDPNFKVELVAKDDRYATIRDEMGVLKRISIEDYQNTGGKLKYAGAASGMSQWLDFPVKTLQDWEKVKTERMPDNYKSRLPGRWESIKANIKHEAEKKIVTLSSFPLLGTFGALRQLMGFENLAFAIKEQPEFVKSIANDLCGLWIKLIKGLLVDVPLDMVILFEDMCYNHGPLIAPAEFKDIFGRSYIRLKEEILHHNVKMHVDTDGDARLILSTFLNCGVDGIIPLEVQSGMDAAVLRDSFPKMFLYGGIDKRALAQGKDAINNELKRCFGIARSKRMYLPWVDHGIPPDVSYDNFRWFADAYRKYSIKG